MDHDQATALAEDIETTLTGQERLDAYRQRADALPAGETGRAVFLAHLAEHLAMAGRLDEARRTYREQMADGGLTMLDPRCGLLAVELQAGETEQADALLAELKASAREDALGQYDYEWIGDSLEQAGRLKEAQRWFTLVLRGIDPAALESLPVGALVGRFRVRRALELPRDAYDDAVEPARLFWQERREALED